MFKISKKIIIPVVVLVVLITIGVIGYFAFNQYKIYQNQKSDREKIIQEEQKSKSLELEKLKQEVEELKNKPPQIVIKNIPIPEKQDEKNLSSIIKQWQSVMVYIQCDFYYKGTNEKYLTQAGSGILEKESFYDYAKGKYSAEINILTNKHVVLDEKIYNPANCTIEIPGYPLFSVDNPFGERTIWFSAAGYDWAIIGIYNPPNYIENIAYKLKRCNNQPSIGDSIVILGYPSIGSQSGITATEGIISGFDGNYYITSAKVEHGNSGGAAILLKDNCYLGIPSYAIAGEIESLARILDSKVVFGN